MDARQGDAAATLPDPVSFATHDETAADLYARISIEPVYTGIPFVDDTISLRRGQVVEFCGFGCCGKTQLLLQAALASVLPKGTKLPSGAIASGGHAVFLDLDGRLDALQVVSWVDRLCKASELPGTTTPSHAFTSACSKFHLVRCFGTRQALAAIRTLRPFLRRFQEQQDSLGILLVDGLSSTYFTDRMIKHPPGPPGPDTQEPPFSLAKVHATLSREVQAIAREMCVPVAATSSALGPGYKPEGALVSWAFRETLPPCWQAVVTHRVLLQKAPAQRGDSLAPREPPMLAQFAKPRSDAVHQYEIGDRGIVRV
ncbi:unnamed protein product [Pedinophyceae sp. YPF-701]|nr:unnamed protein product [Pedinophyceae sp. YPF-701]